MNDRIPLLILLVILIYLLVFYYSMVVMKFLDNRYTYKKEFFYGLIPFYEVIIRVKNHLSSCWRHLK